MNELEPIAAFSPGSSATIQTGSITTQIIRPMRAVVRYTYQAEDGNQLSLQQVGDIITIHSQDSEDWWDGEFKGQRGYLPAKYVELLPYNIPSYSPVVDSDSLQDPDHDFSLAAHDERRKKASHHQQLLQSASVSDSATMYLSPSNASFADPLLQQQIHTTNSGTSSRSTSPHFWSGSGGSHGGGGSQMGISAHSSYLDDPSDGPRLVHGGSSFFANTKGHIFSQWSTSLGEIGGVVALIAGALTLLMGVYNHDYFGNTYTYVGAYSMILGGLTIVYELFWGKFRRGPIRLPIRSVGYGATMVPLLIAYPTRLAGGLYVLVALINLVAAVRGESVITRPRRLDHPDEGESDVLTMSDSSMGSMPRKARVTSAFSTFFLDRLPHRGRRWVFLLGILLFNIGSCTVVGYYNAVWGVGEWNVWHVTGHALTWMILLNLILFFSTSMRHTARAIYDAAERSRVRATRTVANELAASLLTFFPPDPHHALMFYHRLLAGLIMLYSCIHAFAHTLSFMLQPDQTLHEYTYWVYTSGALLLVILLVIYSAARRKLRLASTQLFRWVHALYLPFFVILVFHAPQGFSTAAVLILVLPMGIWLADVAWNYFTKRRLLMPVLSLSFIRPNTIRIEASARLAPSLLNAWSEGSYAYLNFPSLSSSLWLPVTISSAPQAAPQGLGHGSNDRSRPLDPLRESSDDLVSLPGSAFTFHLHVDSSSLSSPTAQWLEYFQSFGPLGSQHFLLDEPGHRRAVSMGRVWDTEGNKILRIDGPHASPVQHLTKYHTSMLIAPSSGVNALSSAMRSVLQHRWKSHVQVAGGLGDSRLQLGAGPGKFFTSPDVLFLYWIVQWNQIDDYRWMVQNIKDCEDELFTLRDAASGLGSSEAYLRAKHFEFHIFVLGVPAETVVGGHGLSPAVHEENFFGPTSFSSQANSHLGGSSSSSSTPKAPFTCLQLYRALKNPTSNVQRFSSVHVHRGAPNWGELFSSVSHRATGQADISCIYTAGPLAAHLTHASAASLREMGLLEVPTAASIEFNRKLSSQLKSNCLHHSAQSGKSWNYHTDVDIL